MQEKKASSHMSLRQGELMIYFLSMFLKHQPWSYSHIKLQMSALKSWRERFFLENSAYFPLQIEILQFESHFYREL